MNPYNTNNNPGYNYSQHTPGPPQPQWQAPPRRGWGDPRLSQQQPTSPVSPYGQNPNSFGPALPPPPPPPPPPGQQSSYDTTAWGVRYNQGLAPQPTFAEEKPPLPPRPESAAGRLSPQPGHGHAHGQHGHSHTHNHSLSYSQSPQSQPPASSTAQPYATSWGDPYQSSAPPPPPPPPAPRPIEYAQGPTSTATAAPTSSQPPYNRVNTPHQEYSHHPPSHHYDPPAQHQWAPQPPPPGPTYYPTAPAPNQIPGGTSGPTDPPLVSPIEGSNNVYWGHQGHGPNDKQNQSQALGFGGPSDWEHYESNPPTDTPTSPPIPPTNATATPAPWHHEQPVPSSTPTPAPLPAPPITTTQNPTPYPAFNRPPSPVEIGANSPLTPRKDSRVHPPPNVVQAPPPIDERERPSSAGPSGSIRSDSFNGNGNIDSVIQAWTSPLRPTHPPDHTARPESRTSGRVASPELSPTVKVVDPYADLEPEFKASLKRYGAMLRKESAADTDEAKFDIFQAFVNKELRLRSLLYGIELPKDAKDVKETKPITTIPPTEVKQPEISKPVETIKREIPIQPPPPATIEPAPKPVESPKPAISQPSLQSSRSPAPAVLTKPVLEPRRPSKDDSFVMVNSGGDEEGEYSPGGRPKMVQKPTVATNVPRTADPFPPRDQSLPKPADSGALSPSLNAPMVIDDYRTPGPPSPGINAPILVLPEMAPPASGASGTSTPGRPSKPIKFEPPRPAYTPFRYSAATQEEKAKSLQPADKSYSTLRHSVLDSGRLMKTDNLVPPTRPATASGRREHEEAFIGLIRQQSMAVRQKKPGPGGLPAGIRPGMGADAARRPTPAIMRVGTPANAAPKDPLKQSVTAIRSILPTEAVPATPIDGPGHPKLKIVQSKVDGVRDEFGFIHAAVVEWDKTNREVRKEQDAERHARQQESENHIDGLFNDNEIGYADIGDLEAEFKLAEAERRFRENQEELESFTTQVFNPVTERLQKEIAELTTAYTLAIDLLDLESEPVSRLLKGGNEKPRMSDVMACVLALFNKIEVRHQKVAEAQVERERRRKHLELTVLYTNGDTAGVKSLEKDFAVAEKLQVLHEARGKDNRANKLMDSFDRATVRGLGDNQTFVDELLPKLQELKKCIASSDQSATSNGQDLYENEGARDTLTLAQGVVTTVITDSRRLLALSNEADVLLNESDYGVSVAEARTATADAATYAKLESEKAKEDMKLVEEMNTRVNGVNKSPADALALIRELIDQIGTDPDHKDRIKKALEAAKQRNS
ncbi:hypothetical protein LTR84_003567 [Exophiala bonariae]|uniref:Actin interacting protein 3 C-terminal domain-containing protein n=1 Tax=Exophiala bonariae TaxID=1690606 RepID=A0AAV9N7G7_9EURO|nr:hypothetical protein LTR84_003567 [Exophiala bonariae]